MKSALLKTCTAVLLASVSGAHAANTCATLLADLNSHVSANPTQNYVAFKLTANRGDAKSARYSHGDLTFWRGGYSFGVLFPASFTGVGEQFYSDREWNEPPCIPGQQCSFKPRHPFSPYQTDQLRLTIQIPWVVTVDPTVVFTLTNQGNAQTRSTAKCEGPYMFGTTSETIYTIAFAKLVRQGVPK
jgi:hypothetical protein